MMILTGGRNTNPIPETKWNLTYLKMDPKNLSQSWHLQALYSNWKKAKGYNKLDPKENTGQMQSSMQDFFNRQKDQGI